jgi:amino acid adenylation domain-containing protein
MRIGILATCTAEFVVTVIATWKTGAAYVPIDPLLPSERRKILYRIGRVDLLAAEGAYLDAAIELADSLVLIDPVDQMPSAASPGPVVSARAGTGLAYVIFTSGSTGEPKAAMLDHAGRVSMTLDLNSRFAVTPQDSMLVVASPSFDMTIYDIFGLLAAGATVVLPSRGQEKDVAHWADLASRHGTTLWHSVPSAAALLLNLWEDRGAGAFRLFLLDGDWIPVDLPASLRQQFPATRVFSLGGATEVSMVSVSYEVTESDPDWRSIPYGRPLGNQTAYVADQFGELAAVDLPGELWLGGAGVGWGYDGRPALTADRFVPDPFGSVPGARLYRTGDLARLRPDGWIELLGRIDQQLKVGGVRIEPGEIEFCLRGHPAVAQATVVPVRDGSPITRSLGAFVTRSDEETAAAGQTDAQLCAALRQHLAERLPAPMLPASIVVVPELPLNHNGKVDRRRLASLARPGGPDAGEAEAAPGQDAVALLVADIWREVLGLNAIPLPHESFLDLGGGSLAAIQVASRLSRHLGVELKVTDLLSADTVAGVAAIASAATQGPAPARKPLLRPRSRATS